MSLTTVFLVLRLLLTGPSAPAGSPAKPAASRPATSSAPATAPEDRCPAPRPGQLGPYYNLLRHQIACIEDHYVPVPAEVPEMIEATRRLVRANLDDAINRKLPPERVATLRRLLNGPSSKLLACEYAPRLSSFRPGALGRMPTVEIVQIIDTDEALVCEVKPEPSPPPRVVPAVAPGFEARPERSKHSDVAKPKPRSHADDDVLKSGGVLGTTFWLKGWATTGRADDQRWCPQGWGTVTGTHAYASVEGGTATVLVVEPIRLDPMADGITRDQFDRLLTKRGLTPAAFLDGADAIRRAHPRSATQQIVTWLTGEAGEAGADK